MTTFDALSYPKQTLNMLVHGGKVVTSGGIQNLDIGINDGVVSYLGISELPIDAQRKIDASGLTILPGCIDAHVHPRDPGQTHKESFETLTQAAAVGGITTFFCQPNLACPITSAQRLLGAAEHWTQNALVDFAIQAMPDPEHPGEIKQLLHSGAISVEFITPDSRGAAFIDLLKIVHRYGGIAGVSCTDWEYAKYAQGHSVNNGLFQMKHWLNAYPPEHEAGNLARFLALTEKTPYELHFHMLTTKRSVELLRWAKKKGRRSITAETAPRYVLLSSAEHLRQGPRSTVVPPLRTSEDNTALWDALSEGTVDLISSDHAPHANLDKEADANIWRTAAGVPEIELSLPLMLNAAREKYLSLNRVVELMSESPARRYGIYPKKGTIQVGSDADMVLVDADKQRTVKNANLCTAPKYSLFDGWCLTGWPVMTLLRGEIVAEHFRVVNSAHRGEWIRPSR
jgi:dihydroorotase